MILLRWQRTWGLEADPRDAVGCEERVEPDAGRASADVMGGGVPVAYID